MIKLRTLYLEKFDYANIEHYTLAKRLNTDTGVMSYISANFLSFIETDESNYGINEYEVLTPYVVKEENKTIGMIGSLEEKNNIVDLWCAINPKYRCCGYAGKVLSQITQYLIEEKYDDVMLLINKNNLPSNKVAIGQGYIKVKTNQEFNVYKYFGK